MTVSYPLTPPSTPGQSSFEAVMFSNVVSSTNPFNWKRTTQEHSGKKWMFTIALPAMTRQVANPWFAFLSKLDGVRGTFLYGSYLWRTPIGAAGGTPLVKGAGQSGQSLLIDGATPSAQFFKAGDMFQIDYSLYQCLNDVSADGSGNVAIDIWPNLRGHSNDAPLITSAPKCLMRLRENGVRITENVNKHYLITIEAEEAL